MTPWMVRQFGDRTLRGLTWIISPTHVVTLTRRHKPSKRAPTTEFVLTIGKPNVQVRDLIKRCKAKGKKPPRHLYRFY